MNKIVTTRRPLLRSPAVTRGDVVAVVATSANVTDEQLGWLVAHLERRGLRARVDPGATTATGFTAGSAARRACVLMDAFADPEVRLIVPATGGRGAAHLVDLLDYDVIAENPTVITGVSDPSVLLNAIHARTGLATLHGPSGFDFFAEDVNAFSDMWFWRAITGELVGTQVTGDGDATGSWRVARGAGERVEGHVVAGHLGTLRQLVGSPWLPDLDGAVLAIEEIGATWSDIDQSLTHLRLAGVFDQLASLMVGVPVDCPRADSADPDWDSMILRCVPGSFPIVTNVPFGHTPHKIPLVVGGRIRLDAARADPRFTYLDDCVALV